MDKLACIHSLIGRFGGKKFIAMLIAVALALQNGHFITLSDATLKLIMYVNSAFILGQGAADGLSGGATSSVAQNHKADVAVAQASQDV